MTDSTGSRKSETPRTDLILEASDRLAGIKDVTPYAVQELCRQLERELAARSETAANRDFGAILNRLQRRAMALHDNWNDAEARALVIDLSCGNAK